MPPKELTPHQLSKGISYVHKEPPFLAKLKGKQEEQKKAAQKFYDYVDGQVDDDYDELEGAQVVTLDDKGKEVHPKVEEEEEEEKKEEVQEEEEDKPAVDENGRLLFRARKKKVTGEETSKRKDRDGDETNKKKNKKKKKAAVTSLSFED
ncbi:hypothetical protein DFQ28_006466 [Apophysomyces sp. BC1034]|nr:hypothetical protein DFQ30_004307 [Apophysomyces sp. BC1015]KAG0182483.1 hypothetical protein DFQ29_003912 [Apophysomyces sp. BC1021]KAG0193091.1 hypothetical protein DFQ28_006466 [Apophysomyces sp. BC1034]